MTVTVFSQARIVDPSRGIDEFGSIIVEGSKIMAAGAAALNQGAPEGATVIDCDGKAVLPGLVDSRVFIGEPGAEHLGLPMLLPGGENGRLVAFEHADDGSTWRYTLEFRGSREDR